MFAQKQISIIDPKIVIIYYDSDDRFSLLLDGKKVLLYWPQAETDATVGWTGVLRLTDPTAKFLSLSFFLPTGHVSQTVSDRANNSWCRFIIKKNFFFVTDPLAKQATVFVPCVVFQPGLIFESKARAYLFEKSKSA